MFEPPFPPPPNDSRKMLRKRRAAEVFLVATRVSSLYDVRSFCAAAQLGEVAAKPRMKTDTPVGVNSVLPRFCSEPTEEDIKLLSVEKIAPSIVLVHIVSLKHTLTQHRVYRDCDADITSPKR